METWTIQKLLEWIGGHFEKKGIDSPRLSAELLLAHVLGMQRIELYMHFDRTVDTAQRTQLRELVKRASEHEPLAYLTGHKEFYSIPFKVTRGVLIPRPETEMLVERAVDFLRARSGEQRVLDLCTGSGCIAIAIARNVKAARVVAIEKSHAALEVARENIEKHEMAGRVTLLEGDLFGPLESTPDNEFDVIVSNPPYVSDAEYTKLDANVKEYEPAQAFLAGEDGLDVYRAIASDIRQYLKPGGEFIAEIGHTQADEVRKLLNWTGIFAEITVSKDFAGNDRMVCARRSD